MNYHHGRCVLASECALCRKSIEKRITALEVERLELPHDSLCATTISDKCDCYKRALLKQDQKS